MAVRAAGSNSPLKASGCKPPQATGELSWDGMSFLSDVEKMSIPAKIAKISKTRNRDNENDCLDDLLMME